MSMWFRVIVVVLVLAAAYALYEIYRFSAMTYGVRSTKAEFVTQGPQDAKLVMVEFIDYNCGFCREIHPSVTDFIDIRPDIRYIARPIAVLGEDSARLARLALAAGLQDKFWDMHTHLFANALGEDVGSFTDKRIKSIAEAAGLDMAAFNSCYDSGKYLDRIQQDFEDGQAAGINGTPGFLVTYTVNGETKSKLIEGAQPFATFQQELEAALNEIGTQSE